jgi:phosphoribosyl-AMP cyclohydrolase
MLECVDKIIFNKDGLIPAIAQDYKTGKVLMLAWMTLESIKKTLELNSVVYFSRSRKKLWLKGEESGHFQLLKSFKLDCDGDSILLLVEQKKGIACHTGRSSCFYRTLENNKWKISEK